MCWYILISPFHLRSNGVEVFNLPASNVHKRIADVFGKKIDQEIIPLGVQTTLCNVSGFVGKPESAKKRGVRQFFFVNGRFMKHPYFNKAVQSAFERLISTGDQVPYFIYFDVAPENIDVNIHPTKTEIKFENEQAVWQILAAAVKDAVGKFSEVPTIDFDTEGAPTSLCSTRRLQLLPLKLITISLTTRSRTMPSRCRRCKPRHRATGRAFMRG